MNLNINGLNLYDQQDVILLGIWKTRCTKPRIDLVIWRPGNLEPEILRYDNCPPSFLKTRYCDPNQSFDVKKAKEYIYLYIFMIALLLFIYFYDSIVLFEAYCLIILCLIL